MARLIALVLLRWRTELRGLLRARERVLGLVIAVPGLLILSAAASLAAAFGIPLLEQASSDAALHLLSAAATGLGLFWALSPLLTGVAFTESHDLSRLLHFPIPGTTLMLSSLLANLGQPMVLAALPVLLAVSLGTARGLKRLPLAAAGVFLAFAFVLVAAQVVGLLLHGLSRNRRLADLALFLGLGLGFVLSLLPLLLMAGGLRAFGPILRLLLAVDFFAASPFAWGVWAAIYAGRGEPFPYVVHMTWALLAVAVAIGLQTALIHRIYRGGLDLGRAGGGAAGARARMRFSGSLGALFEKDLRAAWRDPALKATLLMGFVGPLLFLFLLSQTETSRGTGILFLASFVGLSVFGANAFGLERRGIALLLGFPVPRSKILLGKNLAALVLRLPGLLTLVAAGALLAPLSWLPAMATIALATLLICAGVDNYVSILFPVPAPEPGKNPYGPATGGRGLGAAALGALFLAGALLVASPFVFLAWLPLLLGAPWLWTWSLPLAGAFSVYAMLVAGAGRLLSVREPELLERILVEA